MTEPPETHETNEERSERASRLLEQRVRRETIVDGRLDGHDRRLAAINGQLERGAKATELLVDRVLQLDTRLTKSVDELRADLNTKRKVDDALRERAENTLKQQITRREFWLGIAAIVIAVLTIAINAGVFG